jgi:orotidine-5'-phosphate decarboxylase
MTTNAGEGDDAAAPRDVHDQLIVALDVASGDAALKLDAALGDAVRWVKVGLQLFTAEGPPVVSALRERGRRVFLDLKLHDIPQTVAGAVWSAASHGVELLTLHAEGGPRMMETAAQARDASGGGLRLLAVTVLTSLDGTEYPDVYRSPDTTARVLIFARAAQEAGVDGVVCSPLELESLAALGPDFLRVTPGIRAARSAADDQARIATPAFALRAGASHLVVGRPITKAPDPAAAAAAILLEMASVSA